MATCDVCGTEVDMPYECHRCGGTFCSEHRLPERHDCPGLNQYSGSAGGGRFDSDFGSSGGRTTRSADTAGFGPDPQGGLRAYVHNNMTYVFLVMMWLTFGLQLLVSSLQGPAVHDALFVLEPTALGQVWTWVTAIFAHGGINHIIVNSIALYFFGPLVERRVGSRNFAALFLGAGVVAGLAHVLFDLLTAGVGPGVLGASGAVLAIMGVLTILNPDLRVLLFFVIPMPLWVLTLGFAAISILISFGVGPGAGGVAHFAHLVGLLIGLAYGQRLKQQGVNVPNQMRLGGGPGGPGGRF